MLPSEVRGLADDELARKEAELRESVARLTMKRNARRLDKPSDLIAARRDLARVLTVRNERASGKGARA